MVCGFAFCLVLAAWPMGKFLFSLNQHLIYAVCDQLKREQVMKFIVAQQKEPQLKGPWSHKASMHATGFCKQSILNIHSEGSSCTKNSGFPEQRKSFYLIWEYWEKNICIKRFQNTIHNGYIHLFKWIVWFANLVLTWLVYVQSDLKRLLICFLTHFVCWVFFFLLRETCLSFLTENIETT